MLITKKLISGCSIEFVWEIWEMFMKLPKNRVDTKTICVKDLWGQLTVMQWIIVWCVKLGLPFSFSPASSRTQQQGVWSLSQRTEPFLSKCLHTSAPLGELSNWKWKGERVLSSKELRYLLYLASQWGVDSFRILKEKNEKLVTYRLELSTSNTTA